MEEVASAKGSAFSYVNLKFKCEVRLAGLASSLSEKQEVGPKVDFEGGVHPRWLHVPTKIYLAT